MLTRTQLSAILVSATVVWGISLLLSGATLSWAHLGPYGTTVGVVGVGLIIFDRWLWRWPACRGWLVNTPDIGGTWKVRLQSSYIDPETGEAVKAIDGVMTVVQTYSSLIVRLVTDKSSSYTIGYDIRDTGGGVFEVIGVYQNDPRIELRGSSSIHYGTFKLQLMAGASPSLEGHYWTDRGTNGNFVASQRQRKAPK